MQARYGVVYRDWPQVNFAAHVPEMELRSLSWGELQGVLHAILQRRVGECLPVMMDSLHMCKGIVEWSPKWRRHGWRTLSEEVGHRNLWEQILWERERVGADLVIRWVPPHWCVEGNAGADQLAKQGRQAHPNNLQPLPKRRRTEPQWGAVGLEDMYSDEGEAQNSGRSGEEASVCPCRPWDVRGQVRG